MFKNLIEIFAYPPDEYKIVGWLVAYSGGLDSRVLLELVAQANRKSCIPLKVIHVNHGVNSAADQWEADCASVVQSLSLPFEVIRLPKAATLARSLNGASCNIYSDGCSSTGNLEARLRKLRYEKLADHLMDNWCLLLAHHADDQAETVLLQLLRGSGVRGLSGMPSKIERWERGFRWRPLLHFSKDHLRDYATKHQWTWIEDDSNQDTRYRRNFIRHTIMPHLKQLSPAIVSNINRTAGLMADGSCLLDELAQMDWQNTQNSAYPDSVVLWSPLKSLSRARRNNLWRYIFHFLHYSMPSFMQLDLLHNELVMAKSDAVPVLNWPELTLRRFRDSVYILPRNAVFSAPYYDKESGHWVVVFPDGKKCLVERRCCAECDCDFNEAIAKLKWCSIPAGAAVTIARNGEKMVRRWSKFAQNAAIPPWWRFEIPVLLINDILTVVPGFWADSGWCWRWE